MIDKKSIQAEASFLENLRDLCVVYEQISVMRMKEIRDKVLYTRGFYSQLDKVYVRLKKTYHRQLAILAKKRQIKDPRKAFLLGKNEKRVVVFIGADNRFYGDIFNKVFYSFLEDIKKNKDDVLIIGRLGKSMYDNLGPKKPYRYFEIGDEVEITLDHLKAILKVMTDYSRIDVYYGQYKNLFNQEVVMKNITGDFDTDKKDDGKKGSFYYFEPDLEKILLFFETQIFANLFKQTAYESQLARYASRISAMEQALVAINERTGVNIKARIKLANLEAEKKQRERISQIFLRRQL